MAIAVGAGGTGTITSGNTEGSSGSITVSGSDTIGFVFIAQQNDASANRVTGITWNGVAMTLAGTALANATSDAVYLWYIIGPTTGVVTATRTGTGNTGWFNCEYYTGAKQSAQPDAYVTKKEVTNTLVTSLTTVADNCWTILGVFNPEGAAITASTNSTERQAVQSFVKLFDNNTDITPAGSYSMTVTRASGASEFISAMASFAPVVTGPTFKTSPTLLMMGVG